MENNKVYLLGEILTELTFSHEMYGEKFYQCDLGVSRLSDSIDTIPLLVSDRLLMNVDTSIGNKIEVNGQFNRQMLMIQNVFTSKAEQVGNAHRHRCTNDTHMRQ